MPSTQWAAVRTYLLDITVAPQYTLPCRNRAASHGKSLMVESSPPTIRLFRPRTPQTTHKKKQNKIESQTVYNCNLLQKNVFYQSHCEGLRQSHIYQSIF
jgi:hypothetical protein